MAETDAEIELGLSYRESLPADTGMLFQLGYGDTYPRVWMKGMEFPLDIIWIDKWKVVDIHHNVPNEPLDTPEEELPLYIPASPVDMVLEVNAGYAKEHDIQVGDNLEWGQN